ncbi:hypothetical protein Neosp_015174 [[Neocosmospora] mangrovei]
MGYHIRPSRKLRLQYLQRESYQPDPDDPETKWTALEFLDLKRPDLALYELTGEDVATLVPYIDVVNEMTDAFIIDDAADLISRPENTNIKAYRYVAKAIYPLSLSKLRWPIVAVDMALMALKSNPVNADSKEADGYE